MSDWNGDEKTLRRDRRIDRLLAEALDRPDAERMRFVEEACGGDEGLRDDVLRLLRLSGVEDDALATGGSFRDATGEGPAGEDRESVGRRIGAYRLLRPLGQGGSATVYLAERADGEFEHEVAIKLLRSDDAVGLASRLGQERQILAGLKHPNIATLLDGGTTEEGRPFLVVEHVAGRPITLHCAEHVPPLRGRLELFLDVAGAVQHAHRHLVVHRDIKPSNILVTGEGQVKLLDFGIAKLLGPDGSGAGEALTRTVGMWMTPRYASPEQLLGEPITTASDVYQLGLLLFELLAGRPAFEGTETTPSALVAAARERRSVQPGEEADVPADLDAIVANATRPEPERRYASVDLLAADVRAFLAGRPVQARGDSLAYRARRFVGRHRLSVTLSAVLVLAAAALLIAVAWGFVTARRERTRAEAIGGFLKDTLRGAQPYVAEGRDTELLEAILRDAAGRIDTELSGQPYAAADVHLVIAETLRMISDYDGAAIHAGAAAGAFEEELGPDARETLHTRQLLGLIYWERGQYPEAEAILRENYERARRVLGERHELTMQSLSALGLAVRAQGRLQDAEPLYRRSMELALEIDGPTDEATIGTIGNLAFLLAEMDRLDEAEPLARRAADLSREHLGMDNPDTFLAIDKLAALLGQRGELEKALELHEEAYAGLVRVLGERHSTTLGSAYSTSIVLRRLGRYEESLDRLRSILPIIREDYGPESRFMFPTLLEMGRTLLAAGRADEALPLLEESRRIAASFLPPDHHLGALISIHLADALIETGSPDRAQGLLVEARAVLEARFGAEGTHRYFEDLVRVEAKHAALTGEGEPLH
jgi:serine/threonine-protein kinase